MPIRSDLRNVAIIAHVDHGKTTLVDAMLRQSGAWHTRAEMTDRVLDSMDLEREKGITILAKNTAVRYGAGPGGVTINIIDTPGHADFGGEVERGLTMLDSPSLEPLFRTLLDTIPPPSYVDGAPLQAHVTNLDASPFLGRLALCRVRQGEIRKGRTVAWCRADGTVEKVRISELLMTEALERTSAERAGPGDIIAVAGIPEIMIG